MYRAAWIRRACSAWNYPRFFRPAPRVEVDRQHTLPEPTLEAIRAALNFIPNDGNYEDWINILMAVNHGFRGAKEGLDLVQEWCAGYPGYSPQEVAQKWHSFDAGKSGGVTVGTLFAEAREHGWDGRELALKADLGSRVHPSIQELNDSFAFVRMGTKVAIAEFKKSGDIEFMATPAFREFFSNRRYGFTTLGNAWIKHPERRTYGGGIVFRPDGACPEGALNLWTGWAIEPDPDAY